ALRGSRGWPFPRSPAAWPTRHRLAPLGGGKRVGAPCPEGGQSTSQEALVWLNGLPKGEVRLKPTARRLLECLALHHRHETGCYISQARLANEAVVSRGTVNNCLNILEREGLIARERRGSPARGVMQTTRYHFPF